MTTKPNSTTCPFTIVGLDENPFRQLCYPYSKKMNGAGTNKDKAIVVDKMVSGKSGPVVPTPTAAVRSLPVPPISSEEQQRAMKRQEAMLAHYKENMDKKPAAKQVTPENKKKRAVEEEQQGRALRK